MAHPPQPGHWFMRGVQSAVFYYLSCTPYIEHKHRQKRRREAEDSARARAEIIDTQPGLIPQPGPFQTNPAWADEVLLGPGPPERYYKETGGKPDKWLQKLRKQPHGPPPGADENPLPQLPAPAKIRDQSGSGHEGSTATIIIRPSLERRVSYAIEKAKDSIRATAATLHPPKWNWNRYDREDEILSGFTKRVTSLWSRVTSGSSHGDQDDGGPREATYRRKRATTSESEQQEYDYFRPRIPSTGSDRPPVISRLPATRADAAWMLLPPPSAAVMAGLKRPAAEPEIRRPLCVIGGTPKKKGPNRPPTKKQAELSRASDSDETGSEEGTVGTRRICVAPRYDDLVMEKKWHFYVV